jgi:DNA-binding SARP family transcriptional activator
VALRILLFGRPGIESEGGFAPFSLQRRFQLLVYLACARDWVDRERLAVLFWPDHSAEAARRNLRQVVHRSQEVAGVEGLEMRRNMLRWPVTTDLHDFDARLTQNDFEGALRLYRGVLLEDFESGASLAYCEWLQGERLRCAHARRDATLARIAAQDPITALPLAQSLLADDGLDEDALAASVQALLALGRRSAAEQLFQRYAVRLAAYSSRLRVFGSLLTLAAFVAAG